MIQLQRGPHDGMDATGIVGDHVHLFVIDNRKKDLQSFVSYHFRKTSHEDMGFTFQVNSPPGVVGIAIIVG